MRGGARAAILGLTALAVSCGPAKLPYSLTPEHPLGEPAKVEAYLAGPLALAGPTSPGTPAVRELAGRGTVREYTGVGAGFESRLPQCIDLVFTKGGELAAVGGVCSPGGSASVRMFLDGYKAAALGGKISAAGRKVEVTDRTEHGLHTVILILR